MENGTRVNDNNYVVYAYAREDGTFYYIGKGRPRRPYNCKQRKTKCPKDKRNIVILHRDLDENTAFNYEINLILMYGRKDSFPDWGVLENKTNGGEGFSGFCLKGKDHPYYGKSRSRLVKEKISRANKGANNGMYGRYGEKNPMFGKTHTPEVKAKLSELGKQRTGPKNLNYTPRNWYHPDYGYYYSRSITDLMKIFPEQKLSYGNMSSVATGKRRQHKEWVIVE